MMIRMAAVVVSVALLVATRTADAETGASGWEIAHQSLPALPDGISSEGIGCVVVGMRVQEDGNTAQPMILQGAFSGHVTQTQQKLFSAAAIEASRSWRFRFVGGDTPGHRYVTQSVGFGSGDGKRVVAGIEALAQPLRQACQVEDLAAWGERNAIPVEEAIALHGGRTAIGGTEGNSALWANRLPIVTPRFPSAALRDGVVACVMLGFRVDSAGRTTDFKILGSRTEPGLAGRTREMFENVSLVAASQWTYSPTPANLERLPEFRQVPVAFAMDGNPAPPCPEFDLEASLQGIGALAP